MAFVQGIRIGVDKGVERTSKPESGVGFPVGQSKQESDYGLEGDANPQSCKSDANSRSNWFHVRSPSRARCAPQLRGQRRRKDEHEDDVPRTYFDVLWRRSGQPIFVR